MHLSFGVRGCQDEGWACFYIHFLNAGMVFRLAVSKAHIAKIMISHSTMAITT